MRRKSFIKIVYRIEIVLDLDEYFEHGSIHHMMNPTTTLSVNLPGQSIKS